MDATFLPYFSFTTIHAFRAFFEIEISHCKPNTILYYCVSDITHAIIQVGGGIGGLSVANSLANAGHEVTVLEAAAVPGEIGAGLQIAANVSRVLIRWGLSSKLKEVAELDKPQSVSIYRYADGEMISSLQAGEEEGEKRYGAPTYHLHRNDLYKMLYDLAKPRIMIRFASRVTSVDPTDPSVVLQSGEKITADIIIGADGIRSIVRDAVLGGPQKAKYTGDSAYRFLVPTDDMKSDPDLLSLINEPSLFVWAGPQKHLGAYGIRGQKIFNVAACVEDGDEEASYSWTAKGDTDKMRAEFSGWEPRVEKLLALVKSPHVLKYKLMDCVPLKTWVHPHGHVVLLGDACHPMLPYRAQGAAMAIEDAECLGRLFSHVTNRKQVPFLLRAYQDIRFERATHTQRVSSGARDVLHLADGPEQQLRDARMRAGVEVRTALSGGENVSAEKQLMVERAMRTREEEDDAQFGYDISQVTDKWWEENGSTILQLV
ncbi:FAD/NAD-binding domain-containing protein [Rhodocollybia butyracea]|uniref:FAD/NAD-binding domain-containing protein n=1 Tax=Rhodocollybia butyracea TaxID=206335 RepID=A0A9P5Q9Z6_9AGAR|nr:FAD/NAD-binding domain-containing protein [Rhodocollybia butyracea]